MSTTLFMFTLDLYKRSHIRRVYICIACHNIEILFILYQICIIVIVKHKNAMRAIKYRFKKKKKLKISIFLVTIYCIISFQNFFCLLITIRPKFIFIFIYSCYAWFLFSKMNSGILRTLLGFQIVTYCIEFVIYWSKTLYFHIPTPLLPIHNPTNICISWLSIIIYLSIIPALLWLNYYSKCFFAKIGWLIL